MAITIFCCETLRSFADAAKALPTWNGTGHLPRVHTGGNTSSATPGAKALSSLHNGRWCLVAMRGALTIWARPPPSR
jgi:hypothetical protein